MRRLCMFYRFKQLVPASWKLVYHRVLAWLAKIWYRNPSKKLIVVGVTGTNGKTTTSLMLAAALSAHGAKTGAITTAEIKIGDRVTTTRSKMTMPGRFTLQKYLREMVDAGCRYAVVETSSQGIAQHRHAGVNYDVAVFTNLTPEHIEAHGGFEEYKAAKLKLFTHVAASPRKKIGGQKIPKIAVVNQADEHGKDFAGVPGFDRVVMYGEGSGYEATDIRDSLEGVRFTLNGMEVSLPSPGLPNVWNALATIATSDALGVSLKEVVRALSSVTSPGRYERIDEGQAWTVIVDYAYEPAALEGLYRAVQSYPHKRIIHVLGGCGGGRDAARRPILGKLAAKYVDIAIVTNEDPYDDPPKQIINEVADGAAAGGKVDGKDLFRIDDRMNAIRYAMKIAKEGDIVLLTGKGNEPWICVADGKKMPWDERGAARRAIRERMVK